MIDDWAQTKMPRRVPKRDVMSWWVGVNQMAKDAHYTDIFLKMLIVRKLSSHPRRWLFVCRFIYHSQMHQSEIVC